MPLPPSDPAALHLFSVLLMAVIRGLSFLLAAECMVALFFIPRGVGSMVVAALFILFFLIFCWTLGAFAQDGNNSKGTS